MVTFERREGLDEKVGKAVKPWTLHDLRRTAATRMADIGVQPHVIEAVLNHVSGHKGGVAGIYNRSIYATEKRAALDLWAGHIRITVAQSQRRQCHQAGAQGLVSLQAIEQGRRAGAPACRAGA